MNTNNRQPKFKPKVFEPRVVYHTEVQNGVTVFVEGASPDPYEGVPCESLKLKSRIDAGVFEDHEGSLRHLEKVQGSDIMTAEIEREQEHYNQLKENYENAIAEAKTKAARKKVRDAMLKEHPELADIID